MLEKMSKKKIRKPLSYRGGLYRPMIRTEFIGVERVPVGTIILINNMGATDYLVEFLGGYKARVFRGLPLENSIEDLGIRFVPIHIRCGETLPGERMPVTWIEILRVPFQSPKKTTKAK